MSIDKATAPHAPATSHASPAPTEPERTGPITALRGRLRRGDLGMLPVVVSLVLITVFFTVQEPAFISGRNLSNLIVQMTVTGTLAIGLVLVLLIGEIDLSAGSVLGTAAAVLGVLLTLHSWPWWAAIIAALAVGTAIGAFHGAWRAIFGVPTFVITLAGFLGWYGVQQHLLGSNGTINVFDDHIAWLTSTYVPPAAGWAIAVVAVATLAFVRLRSARPSERPRALIAVAVVAVLALLFVGVLNTYNGVPTVFLILVAMITVFDILTRRTQFGRHIYAVGGSDEASRRAGISLRKIRILVFALAGFMAAVAAVIAVSRNQSAGTLTGGGTQMLEAIAAAVIGGTSLFGGRGTVWAALFGALVLASVANGIDLLGQPTDIKFIVTGLILLVAVTIDALSRRKSKSATR